MKDFTHGNKTVQVDKNGNIYYKGKRLCYTDNGKGYLTVVIFYKRFYVHRVVLMSYEKPPYEGMDVNHKNGDKCDNRLCNLEWATRSENIEHAYRVLKRRHAKPQLGKSGFSHHGSKAIIQIDINTGKEIKIFGSINEAAKSLKVNQCNISAALHGRGGAKQSSGYKWAFVNQKKELMSLLIKYATRGRPKLFLETLANIQSTIGTDNYEVIVTADEDDELTNTDEIKEQVSKFKNVRIFYGNAQNKVEAINKDVEKAYTWHWMINMSDDFKFVVQDWYHKMISEIRGEWGDSLDFFSHFSDGFVHERLATMNICGRDYYNRFGAIYPGAYKSVSCDSENFLVSQMLGRYKYFPTVYFLHQHPANLRFPTDATYLRNDKYDKEDIATYFDRMSHGFYVENPIFIPDEVKQHMERRKNSAAE